jgi:hypothetical protein
MEGALAQALVESVENEFNLHVKLLRRLRRESADGIHSPPRHGSSARFWGKPLPESATDIWDEMKAAEQNRRQILRRIADDSASWRLSNVVAELPYEEGERLMDLRDYFAVVTTEIITELRLREAEERTRAA